MSDEEAARRYRELMTVPSLHVAEMQLRQWRFMYAQARLASAGLVGFSDDGDPVVVDLN